MSNIGEMRSCARLSNHIACDIRQTSDKLSTGRIFLEKGKKKNEKKEGKGNKQSDYMHNYSTCTCTVCHNSY